MTVRPGAMRKGVLVASCLLLALQQGPAQDAPRKPANAPEATRAILIQKAHALEARGLPDMAIQLWQQVLLSDPKNAESLAGLARDLKLSGSGQAIEALDRLRKVNPNDPNIAKIQALASTPAESADLRQAGDLARQGKADDAMRIYRQLYGDRPPDGDIALAYYQTLYATAGGKQQAIAAMRAAAARNAADPRYSIGLGIMLTSAEKTRAEGIRILKEHPQDLNAQTALRQAIVTDAANPDSAAELRDYLKDHPQDPELEGRLKENEAKLAEMNSGIARTPAERAAFAALNNKRLDEAEKRFTDLLSAEPSNGRAEAGMGLLRMQQNNFPDAIASLEKAQANGIKDRTVEDGLKVSHFWLTMGEASQASKQNQFEQTTVKYREALVLRPGSPEALNGLAGVLVKQQDDAGAALIYDQLLKAEPNSADAWRGLFLAYVRNHRNDRALAVADRFPAPVKAALSKDPEFLHTLAGAYQAANRTADAERVLAEALELPFPGDGSALKADTRLRYAGILTEAKRYGQALPLYAQLLSDDPGSLPAWMGTIGVHHLMGQDDQAIAEIKKMPPATYQAAIADPAFLATLGAIYRQAGQYEVAQGLLERAASIEIAAGGPPNAALQVELAGVYLARNDTAHAYALYLQVLTANPGRADAWKGLIAVLAATNRDGEALQQIAMIPEPAKKQLNADIEFVQTEASLYADAGDLPHAVEFMDRVQAHYAKLHVPLPPGLAIQNAWLLFNTQNDRGLYPELMRLDARADLTSAQRETVQDIWANWSVRRAAAAMDNGNVERAVDILDAVSQAFPGNLAVRKAVAGGYVQVGRAKESLALYKTIPMQDATAADFVGAVSAALAANDKSQAELWLRQALERYAHDPAILSLAARFEQARGDKQRAADYSRASLAVMPVVSAQQNLAHVPDYPEQKSRPHRVMTEADLERLLNPDTEPVQKTTRIPPPPAYVPAPQSGSATLMQNSRKTPAQPPSQPPSQPGSKPSPVEPDKPQAPGVYPPSASNGQTQSVPIYVPQSWTRPRPGSAGQRPHARRRYGPQGMGPRPLAACASPRNRDANLRSSQRA